VIEVFLGCSIGVVVVVATLIVIVVIRRRSKRHDDYALVDMIQNE
jgi:heme/copper-type cytochrome/quinol oxidase subunit 2